MNTTLSAIRDKHPCSSGWNKLLKFLNKTEADDEPLSFLTILESNGIKDAIWCLRVLPDYDLKVMEFKLKSARRVDHLDKSGKAKSCLDVVESFIVGDATKGELCNAAAAADAAYADAYAAAAAYAAYAAAADTAVAYATYAAADTAVAEREYQTQIFKEIFG